MALTVKEMEDSAFIARIHLEEEEKDMYTEQLNSLLNYIDKIKEVNTDNIEPLIYLLPNYNVFRPDEIIPSPSRDEMLAHSVLTEDGYYKVPKIL